MEAVFKKASFLKALIETASSGDFLEVTFTFRPNGLVIQTIDTCRMSFLSAVLQAEHFQTFSCVDDVHIHFQTTALRKVTKMLNTSDAVSMSCNKDNSVAILQKGADQTIDIELITLLRATEELNLQEKKVDVQFELESKVFQKLCQELPEDCVITIQGVDSRVAFVWKSGEDLTK